MFDFLEQWISGGGWWVSAIFVAIGFALLLKGADALVAGASDIARRLRVSDWMIGLTIVAFGTSMPEFVVNMVAAVDGNSEIAITNVLGSNIVNIFVILGSAALIYPITSNKSARTFDIPFGMVGALAVLFFAVYSAPRWLVVNHLFDISIRDFDASDWGHFSAGSAGCFISGIGGAFLLLGMAFFLWHSIRGGSSEAAAVAPPKMSWWRALLLVLLGLLSLIVGGELIVKSATHIAHLLGVSDAVIGLTVVALGTSLPELATSCMAAWKKNSEMALGNVVGSNVFNIFFILGSSAVVHPLAAYDGIVVDAAMAALGGLFALIFIYNTKKLEISRWEGGALLLLYAGYLVYRLAGA